MKMEFEKVKAGKGLYYWTWRDVHFVPYARLERKDLENLPTPFFLEDISPGCKVGFKSRGKEDVANTIELPQSFEMLKIDSGLRKDLRRVERKNEDVKIKLNEKNALGKGKKWFLALWHENKGDFERRMLLWKKSAYTLSAYAGKALLGVHIAMEEGDTVYYLNCWWNRKYKNRSIPTFLLKKDIERAIGRKMKYYDLGRGDESYKKRWGVRERPTRYYAVLTKELAAKLGVRKFREIGEQAIDYRKV